MLPIMPSNFRPRISAFALKTLSGALASAVFLSSSACAAGLGKLTVLSYLGQPLRAEIELTSVSPEEAVGLVAKVAPADAFKLANIDYSAALRSLRFTVEQRNGRQFIKITSSQPLNEPFVDMLLELSWNSGRLVREYTFLLDPVDLRATQSAQVAGAASDTPGQGARAAAPATEAAAAATTLAPAEQRVRAPAKGAGRASRVSRATAPAPSSENSENLQSKQYTVKRGDTLGRIAGELKPGDISLDMMLVALYRANPDAFIGNNMNRLKSGQILSVPDSDAIRGGGSDADARGVVIAHAADFNAYRNKLAGQVANAAPAKSQDGTQSASGKIIAKVEERATAANESKDQLKLSKAASGAPGKSAAPGTEESIANHQALADSTARVKELERNVSDLEKLMAIKSKPGSEASKSALAEASTTGVAAPVTPFAVPLPVAAKPAPVPEAVEVIKVPELVERSFADLLMDNITMIGAALAVLLLGWFGLSRRKPKDTGAPVGPSILGAPTGQAHSMFDATGGHSVDTSDSSNSVFNSSFAPSASQLDTNEVDPVAEADVYIAYGRDAQAEEILREALRTHPERTVVRLKLLEIYAARKDVRAFEVQAGELYGLSRGQGDDWTQAAALGLTIDPLNPLYAPASAPLAPGAAAAAVAGTGVLTALHEDDLSALPAHDRMDQNQNQGQGQDQDRSAAVARTEPQPLAALPSDEHTLDFDLDGLGFETATRTEPVLAADPHDLDFTSTSVLASTVTSEEEPPFDLAFDLAFDSPSAATLPVAPKPLDDLRLDLASDKHSAAFDMVELAREFDLPHLAKGSSSGTVFAEPLVDPLADALADPFADPLAELDAMNFDFPGAPGATAPAPQSALDDDPFALPDLPGAAPSSAATSHFDIADLDLDLNLPFDASDARDAQSLTLEKPTVGAIELSASQMEMETKLDLAIAYQEIGDKEGARELLDEVIKGGSDEQVGKANAMRSRLV